MVTTPVRRHLVVDVNGAHHGAMTPEHTFKSRRHTGQAPADWGDSGSGGHRSPPGGQSRWHVLRTVQIWFYTNLFRLYNCDVENRYTFNGSYKNKKEDGSVLYTINELPPFTEKTHLIIIIHILMFVCSKNITRNLLMSPISCNPKQIKRHLFRKCTSYETLQEISSQKIGRWIVAIIPY